MAKLNTSDIASKVIKFINPCILFINILTKKARDKKLKSAISSNFNNIIYFTNKRLVTLAKIMATINTTTLCNETDASTLIGTSPLNTPTKSGTGLLFGILFLFK